MHAVQADGGVVVVILKKPSLHFVHVLKVPLHCPQFTSLHTRQAPDVTNPNPNLQIEHVTVGVFKAAHILQLGNVHIAQRLLAVLFK